MGAFSNAPVGANSKGAGASAFGGGKGSTGKTRIDWGAAASDYGKAYDTWKQKQDLVNSVNAIAQGKSSLNYNDASSAINQAYKQGIIQAKDVPSYFHAASAKQAADQNAQDFHNQSFIDQAATNIQNVVGGNPVTKFVGDAVTNTVNNALHQGHAIALEAKTALAAGSDNTALVNPKIVKGQQAEIDRALKAGQISQQRHDQLMSAFNAKVAAAQKAVTAAQDANKFKLQGEDKTVGQAADIASNFVPGLAEVKAPAIVAKELVEQTLKDVAKNTLISTGKAAGGGAAVGGSIAALKTDPTSTPQQYLENIIQGAGSGAIFNGTIGAIGGAFKARSSAAATNRLVAEQAAAKEVADHALAAAHPEGVTPPAGGAAPLTAAPHVPGEGETVGGVTQQVGAGAAGELKAAPRVGDNTISGRIDNALGAVNRKVLGAASDALDKTKLGHWLNTAVPAQIVDDHAAIYKMAQRAEDKGILPKGSAVKMRTLIGNLSRTGAPAEAEMDGVKGVQQMKEAGQQLSGSFRQKMSNLKSYLSAKSEVDLANAGKKEFPDEYLQKQKDTVAKFENGPEGDLYKKAHKGLVDANSDLLDKRFAAGHITPEQYKSYKEDPHDYVRQQRELSEWRTQNGIKDKGSGRSFSMTKSALDQSRNKYAHEKLINPIESYRAAYHTFAHERAKQEAGTFLAHVIDKVGPEYGKVLRTTDMVHERRDLLNKASELKGVKGDLEKTLTTDKMGARELQKQMSRLSREGLDIQLGRGDKAEVPEAFRYVNRTELVNGKRVSPATMSSIGAPREITGTVQDHLAIEGGANVREMMKALVTEDPARLRQIRTMIESRDAKLTPLLDKIELMNRKIADVHAQKNGLIQDANGIHINPDTSHFSHFEYIDRGIKNIVRTTPEIAEAVKHLNPPQLGTVLNLARITNNIFKEGTTGVNPIFTLKNLARDWLQSAITSDSFLHTHLDPMNYLTVGMAHMGKFMSDDARKAYEDIYTHGVEGGLRVNIMQNPGFSRRSTSAMMLKEHSALARAGFTVIRPQELLRKAADVVGVTEKDMRMLNGMGTYRAGIRQGMSHEDALENGIRAARENTTDFGSAGSFGRILNQILPYSNAKIQDGRLIARAFRDKPASTLAKFTVGLTVPTIASTVWNTSGPQASVYKNIPDYIKQTNFVVVLPGAHVDPKTGRYTDVLLMPKPQGFAQLTEPVRKFIEYMADTNPAVHKDIASFISAEGTNLASDFANTFSPVDVSSPTAFVGSIIPAGAKGFFEGAIGPAGYNFFQNKQIVPTSEQGLPVADQHSVTSQSQLTNYLGAALGIAPLKIDNWIKETFGGVGQIGQNLTDRYLLGGKEDNVDPATGKHYSTIGGTDVGTGIQKSFYGAQGGADTTAFYKAYNPILAQKNRVDAQVTTLVGQGKRNQAARVAEDFNKSIDPAFKNFQAEYGNSPTYNSTWDDNVKSLTIKTNDRAFNARLKSYQKKQSQNASN